MGALSQNVNGLNYLHNGEIPSEINYFTNPDDEFFMQMALTSNSRALIGNRGQKYCMEAFSNLELSYDDVTTHAEGSMEVSLGDCIIHFVEVVFNFFPYSLMNFQFLEEIFQTFVMPEVETLLNSLQGKFFCRRGATRLLEVITDLLWPNSKLIVVESEERQLEEKIVTEKQAISSLARFIENKSKFINSQQAFKMSAEIISSFRDQEINKHLIFCFVDSVLLKLYQSRGKAK